VREKKGAVYIERTTRGGVMENQLKVPLRMQEGGKKGSKKGKPLACPRVVSVTGTKRRRKKL